MKLQKKLKKLKKPKRNLPNDLNNTLRLAAASYRQKNYRNSITYYDHALKLSPEDPEIYNTLGVLFNLTGDTEKEEKCYLQAIQCNPFHSGANYNLGTIYRIKGDREKAILHLKRSIKSDPKNITTLNNLANLLTEDKQFAEALECYNTILRIDPNYINAIINKACLFLEQGNITKSIALLDRALLIEPENPKALIYAAETMFMEEGPLKNVARLNSIAALKHLDLEDKINIMTAKATCEWILADLPAMRISLGLIKDIIFRVKNETNAANLKRRQAYYVYLEALSKCAPETIKENGEHAPPPAIPVIGDSHCLSPAHKTIILDGVEYRCEPHLIMGIKGWHLGNPAKNKYKYALDRVLQKLNNCPAIFTIGEIDCRSDEGIFSYHRKTNIPIEEIITETVDLFLRFVFSRINTNGITPVFCGVPAPDMVKIGKLSERDKEKYLFTVRHFNSYLLSQVQANGARFIDVYTATAGPDGTSNNKYDLDKLHLQPDFLEKHLYKVLS